MISIIHFLLFFSLPIMTGDFKTYASEMQELIIREKVFEPSSRRLFSKKHMTIVQAENKGVAITGYLLKNIFAEIPKEHFKTYAFIDNLTNCAEEKISVIDSGPFTLLAIKPSRVKLLMHGEEFCTAILNIQNTFSMVLNYAAERLYVLNYNKLAKTIEGGFYNLSQMDIDSTMIASRIGNYEQIFEAPYDSKTGYADITFNKKKNCVHGFYISDSLHSKKMLTYFYATPDTYFQRDYPIYTCFKTAFKIMSCGFSGNTIRLGILQEGEKDFHSGYITIYLSTGIMSSRIKMPGKYHIIWNDYFAHSADSQKRTFFDATLKEQLLSKTYGNMKEGWIIKNSEFLNNRILKIELESNENKNEIRLCDMSMLVDMFKAVKH